MLSPRRPLLAHGPRGRSCDRCRRRLGRTTLRPYWLGRLHGLVEIHRSLPRGDGFIWRPSRRLVRLGGALQRLAGIAAPTSARVGRPRGGAGPCCWHHRFDRTARRRASQTRRQAGRTPLMGFVPLQHIPAASHCPPAASHWGTVPLRRSPATGPCAGAARPCGFWCSAPAASVSGAGRAGSAGGEGHRCRAVARLALAGGAVARAAGHASQVPYKRCSATRQLNRPWLPRSLAATVAAALMGLCPSQR
jgi:hypothetical protein